MKSNKQATREQLQADMAKFFSSGKTVTKCDAIKQKAKKQPKEQIVEIEVDFLPKALQDKYFAE